MQKFALTIAVVVILAAGGLFGYQQYEKYLAHQAQLALEVKQRAFQAAAEAERKKQIAAIMAERQEVEAALKSLKVTSLLPGNPALAIIDKTEYAEGDSLTLANGKHLLIASIKADGISLAGDGLTFHLDGPPEPDLAAARKAR